MIYINSMAHIYVRTWTPDCLKRVLSPMQRSSSFVKESRGGALGCSQARVPGACLTAPRSKSTITRSPIAAALATILGGEARGGAAVWDCVGGGGGCAGGGVPMGAGPCCPDVGRCLSGVNIIINTFWEGRRGGLAGEGPVC